MGSVKTSEVFPFCAGKGERANACIEIMCPAPSSSVILSRFLYVYCRGKKAIRILSPLCRLYVTEGKLRATAVLLYKCRDKEKRL